MTKCPFTYCRYTARYCDFYKSRTFVKCTFLNRSNSIFYYRSFYSIAVIIPWCIVWIIHFSAAADNQPVSCAITVCIQQFPECGITAAAAVHNSFFWLVLFFRKRQYTFVPQIFCIVIICIAYSTAVYTKDISFCNTALCTCHKQTAVLAYSTAVAVCYINQIVFSFKGHYVPHMVACTCAA